ncbi:DNA-binding HxlR family transcriptional regulator [Constrictibacter sp. MBR-5]|jgi:DNA-binding HxlR family transcriptional regulator|uniref:winged helix-turn-helix transcriptional regulator n=1 Tax=Constrictibacter sp. MBR-5 TaxID=3156467 RepID=UPI0033919A35
MRWSEIGSEDCSVARTVSIVGDRWTLLILRDCFLGVRRFEAFQEKIGVTRPILSDRLRKLVGAGVLAKVPYWERPPRHDYRLTEKGLSLYPIIVGLAHWGDTHLSGEDGPPLLRRHKACGHLFDPVLTCSECGEAVGPRDVSVEARSARAGD